MRKFWIVLLSLALIMAFTFPAAAADAKFSGSFWVQGTYDNNRKLADPTYGSVSSIYQRARIGTTFQVAEGLSFTTRFDALEKTWGAAAGYSATPDVTSENIKFENAFVTFKTVVGQFDIGYQTQSRFGTAFGDSGEIDNGGRIKYTLATGPMVFLALLDKVEGQKGSVANQYGTPGYASEHDYEKYSVAGMYNFTGGSAGLLIQYLLGSATADNTAVGVGYKTKAYAFVPYMKGKFGPVYVEAELGYIMGKTKAFMNEGTTAATQDVDADAWRGYIMANVDLAPAYVGAQAFYASGDDPTTADKNEGVLTTGSDYSPCLILMNYDLGKWYGAVGNYVTVGNNRNNILGGQLFAGIKPIPKLDVKFSVTAAKLNENLTTTELVSKNLGYEADLTASYKIYDNLEYMIGFGYLWAGDAFKGTVSTNTVENDYIVTHKLSLVF
ncbi:MAG: hypothetical protein NTW12_00400 [Deltaproteobacteria bacterium]|nr:hypothetical protein [Deltaproteobacteria bacterium]